MSKTKAIRKKNNTGYALTDEDIKIINKAFNKKNNYPYYTKNDGSETIILQKERGEFPNNNIIIELPALSLADSKVILKDSIKTNLDFIKNNDDLKEKNIKFIAPYKLNSWHWNVLEILYDKNNNKISCKSYDTDGKIKKVENEFFNHIENAFKEEKITVENHLESTPYYDISAQKGVNCGIVTAIIMQDLKAGNKDLYNEFFNKNKSDEKIREEIDGIVKEKLPLEEFKKFCHFDENQVQNFHKVLKPNIDQNASSAKRVTINDPKTEKREEEIINNKEEEIINNKEEEIINNLIIFCINSKPSAEDFRTVAKIIMEDEEKNNNKIDKSKKVDEFVNLAENHLRVREEQKEQKEQTTPSPNNYSPIKTPASSIASPILQMLPTINQELEKLVDSEDKIANEENFNQFLMPEKYSGIGALADCEYDKEQKMWILNIKEVFADSPAQKLKLKKGDRITAPSELGDNASLIEVVKNIRNGQKFSLQKNEGKIEEINDPLRYIFEKQGNNHYKKSNQQDISSSNLSR